ncbi:hypothetical protein [uncultured Marinobacter sp.]|uniref:hypothetical protein n=1 Tax=uncultured Marinobacter sp. TaxID=187379 RepID=UPI0025D4C81C|nr:hypothetical protein [uncultured Marinobacter sp.]
MRFPNSKKLQTLYRQMKYRRWIRSQLEQAGGADYLRRLETDIGAEPGHFRRELEKRLISKRKAKGSDGAAGLDLHLPPLTSLRKV